ncbi:MAG: hypothetical protein M3Z05_14530 [Gemmatimonadota bacterium]|nr:hypothetical protein [Gemmatimonadota bacterium]
MTKLRFAVLASSAVTLASTSAGAQNVPPGQMPPLASAASGSMGFLPAARRARPIA